MDIFNPKMISSDPTPEVTMSEVIHNRFAKGEGLLTISENMPDAAILLAIRAGLSSGKPFTVVPLNCT